MERKSHLQIARLQMACSGLSIVDRDTLYTALPSNWASSQDALLSGLALREIVSALTIEYPAAHWFKAQLGGRPVLGLARTLGGIEQRIETLTGHPVKALTPTQNPLSVLNFEPRDEPFKPTPEPDVLDGFDLAQALATIPHHTCAVRASRLELIETYWLRHPETFDATAYLGDERDRREMFAARLQAAYPDLEFPA